MKLLSLFIYCKFLFPVLVGTVGKTGIMFLNEVALGKSQIVKQNQSHLKAAPAGYDSVLAIGCTEPGRYICVGDLDLIHSKVRFCAYHIRSN